MNKIRGILLASVAFFAALGVGAAFIYLLESRRDQEKRVAVGELAAAQAHTLERQFTRSLSSTFALSSMIKQGGPIKDFAALAADMVKVYGGINTLALAPDGVIRQIYPLKGNEGAIGHNLLKDPKRRTEALAAMKSRKLTLAGPFKLIQRPVMAVIGRYPVFVPDASGGERFWGFTTAVVELPSLLKASNFDRILSKGYEYELWRLNPDTRKRDIFSRSSDSILIRPLSFRVNIPNGFWTLSVAPKDGWRSSFSYGGEFVLVLLTSMLVGTLAYFLIRQPEVLRERVKLRTKELANSNEELESEISERLRIEGELRKSEGKYRTLFEDARDGIELVDREGLINPWDPVSGESLMAKHLRWLDEVVNALTGASSSSRQIKFSHELGIISHGNGKSRLDGGRLFGTFLTDTVSYYH